MPWVSHKSHCALKNAIKKTELQWFDQKISQFYEENSGFFFQEKAKHFLQTTIFFKKKSDPLVGIFLKTTKTHYKNTNWKPFSQDTSTWRPVYPSLRVGLGIYEFMGSTSGSKESVNTTRAYSMVGESIS